MPCPLPSSHATGQTLEALHVSWHMTTSSGWFCHMTNGPRRPALWEKGHYPKSSFCSHSLPQCPHVTTLLGESSFSLTLGGSSGPLWEGRLPFARGFCPRASSAAAIGTSQVLCDLWDPVTGWWEFTRLFTLDVQEGPHKYISMHIYISIRVYTRVNIYLYECTNMYLYCVYFQYICIYLKGMKRLFNKI